MSPAAKGSSEKAGKQPTDSAGFLMWRVSLRWQRAISQALTPLGLTHPQFVLLASVSWMDSNGVTPTQRELADHTGMDPMTTSQVIRALESKDLIKRSADPQDSRVWRVAPTRAGKKLGFAAIEVVEGIDDKYFEAVSAPSLLRILRKLDAANDDS